MVIFAIDGDLMKSDRTGSLTDDRRVEPLRDSRAVALHPDRDLGTHDIVELRPARRAGGPDAVTVATDFRRAGVPKDPDVTGSRQDIDADPMAARRADETNAVDGGDSRLTELEADIGWSAAVGGSAA